MSSGENAAVYDIAIVGAGAAGLMAAIFCGGSSRKVLLLDGKQKPGSKILISGGGRCNLTHQSVTERDYSSGNPRTVRNILRSFSVEKTIEFFEGLGIELVDEEEGKLFPRSQRAQSVREALLNEVGEKGVLFKVSHQVTGLQCEAGIFKLSGEDFQYRARSVILCTGGRSYPETGSDGSGYRLARSLGHSLTETTPALSPLVSEDPDWLGLTGISLPCRLTLSTGGNTKVSSEGPLLFTHLGFSGPCVLDISRHWVRAKDDPSAELTANFMPDFTTQEFRDILTLAVKEEPGYTVKNFLSEKLPERLIDVLFAKISLDSKTVLNQLKNQDREQLVNRLYRCPLPVKDIAGYDKAEVTAGGVPLSEVDPHTLESKVLPGLFFAGEVLDVDGRIGGFNFQWAWSSAVAAASGALKRLRRET